IHRDRLDAREHALERALERIAREPLERPQRLREIGARGFERVEEHPRAPHEDAAVPGVLAARDPLRRALAVGLLGEAGHTVRARSERGATPDVAQIGL